MRLQLTTWLLTGFTLIGGALAQTTAVLPANAVASRYGDGWQCMRGHERIDKVCNPIQVPEHGFLNFSGEGWQCERNYVRRGQACLPIRVPAGGYADGTTFGDGWRCSRGFQERDGACAKVAVPVNGYLVSPPTGGDGSVCADFDGRTRNVLPS